MLKKLHASKFFHYKIYVGYFKSFKRMEAHLYIHSFEVCQGRDIEMDEASRNTPTRCAMAYLTSRKY